MKKMSDKQFDKFKITNDFFITMDFKERYDKSSFFDSVAQLTVERIGVSKQSILKSILEREKLKNTAFAYGLAFPHIILKEQVKPRIIICKLANGITDWRCFDNTTVNTCLFLVISKSATKKAAPIQRMEHIFRKFADDDFVQKISKCKNATEIEKML